MSDQQPVFGDRYQMIKHIARGGMAQVYLARDLLLDRQVALKVLFPELSVDRSFVERFRREAKAAANLSHPNIVSVYDWGQGEHTYFIVMEYVDGYTLSSLLKQGPVDPMRAATIGSSVAAALDFAHRRGVIHRDVKPGNVLIDDHGAVKVADFGIARAVGTSEDLTQTGSVMGTATYFSPEQAQGYPVDARSDVYSLGVVLYEMAAGKPPFAGENPVAIAYKHVKEAAPLPSEINPGVPPAFEAIVMKAMAKDPADRYQSAEDLRADLLRFAVGQPVGALAEATRAIPAAGAMGEATTVIGAGGGGDATRVQTALGGGGGSFPTTTMGRTASGPPVPMDEDESRTGLYALIAVVVILLVVGGFFGARAAGVFGKSAKTLTVPSGLVNITQAAAQAKLAQAGFSDVKVQMQDSSGVASGNVISVDPSAGTQTKSNAPVTLTVSSGAKQVQVPTVAGKDYATASQTLQQAGFVPTETMQASNTVAQGTVISTSPPGGQNAAQGAHVQVVVSSGKANVNIPQEMNQSPAQAGQALGTLGLNVTSATEPSSTVPAGQVTRTDPPAGTSVQVGSTVTVYTSTGPPQVPVPDLSNDTQAQAQAALTQAGLKANFSFETVSNQSQGGIVQPPTSPPAGTSVAQGTTVNVVIGQYQSSSTTTSSVPSTTTTSTAGGGGAGT